MSKLNIAFYKIYKIVIRKVQRVLEVTWLRVSLGAMVTPVGGKLDVAFLSGELGAVVEAELRGHWMPVNLNRDRRGQHCHRCNLRRPWEEPILGGRPK